MGTLDNPLSASVNVEVVKAMIRDSLAAKQKVLADEALLASIVKVSEVVVKAFQNGRKVMLAGNGGSAADSQHIAAEFVSRFEFDRPGLPSIALTTDTSMLTAIGNDYGYEKVFERQIQANGVAGDVFIGISTSGNSKNVVKAVAACKAKGITTVALCGAGGVLKDLCDYALPVPSTHTPRIQENHILIGHAICAMVEEAIWGAEYKPKSAP